MGRSDAGTRDACAVLRCAPDRRGGQQDGHGGLEPGALRAHREAQPVLPEADAALHLDHLRASVRPAGMQPHGAAGPEAGASADRVVRRSVPHGVHRQAGAAGQIHREVFSLLCRRRVPHPQLTRHHRGWHRGGWRRLRGHEGAVSAGRTDGHCEIDFCDVTERSRGGWCFRRGLLHDGAVGRGHCCDVHRRCSLRSRLSGAVLEPVACENSAAHQGCFHSARCLSHVSSPEPQ